MSEQPQTLLDTIRRIVRDELKRVQGATLAIVQEQHTGDGEYACTVALRDSELVLKRVPIATARMGLAAIPAVDDLVLVQFLNGDINRPIIIGSLYNDEDSPPANDDAQWVGQLPLGAGDGSGVSLLAKGSDPPSLELTIGGGLVVTLQDDDPVVQLDVGSGSAALTIDSDGTISVKGGRGLSIEAGTDLELKGVNVKIEGSGEVTVKGAVIKLN
jgi:hypothetical protein